MITVYETVHTRAINRCYTHFLFSLRGVVDKRRVLRALNTRVLAPRPNNLWLRGKLEETDLAAVYCLKCNTVGKKGVWFVRCSLSPPPPPPCISCGYAAAMSHDHSSGAVCNNNVP